MIYTDGKHKYLVCQHFFNVCEPSEYYTIGVETNGHYDWLCTPFFKDINKAQKQLDKLAKKNNWEVVSNGKSSSSGI